MKKYLKAYLYNRPLFYSFIRPKELDLFAKYLPYKKPILDFGCGDGFFAKTLLQKGKIDVGIDVNEKVKREAEGSGIYESVIIYKDKKIPFKSGYFSTVISNCVLEHVDDLDQTVKEIRRVMKVGGTLYLTVMTKTWEKYLLGGKFFGKRYLNWMRKTQRHPNLLLESEWENRFRKTGFKIVDKCGYIDREDARLIETFHYLSINSLISRKLFGKWVLFPQRLKIFEKILVNRNKNNDISIKNSAANFYVLEK